MRAGGRCLRKYGAGFHRQCGHGIPAAYRGYRHVYRFHLHGGKSGAGQSALRARGLQAGEVGHDEAPRGIVVRSGYEQADRGPLNVLRVGRRVLADYRSLWSSGVGQLGDGANLEARAAQFELRGLRSRADRIGNIDLLRPQAFSHPDLPLAPDHRA